MEVAVVLRYEDVRCGVEVAVVLRYEGATAEGRRGRAISLRRVLSPKTRVHRRELS